MLPSLRRIAQLNSSIFVPYAAGRLRSPLKTWVLIALQRTPRTFSELYWRSGWSDTRRNLLYTLMILGRENFIERREAPKNEVVYALTPQGADLADLVAAVHDWVEGCEIRSRSSRFAPTFMHHQPARTCRVPADVAGGLIAAVE